MRHLDSGEIHAWLDGALDAERSSAVERHVVECARCAEAVAEERGLIAASSRILGALDDVPGDVIPAATTAPVAASIPRAARDPAVIVQRGWGRRAFAGAAIAAAAVIAVVVVTDQGRSPPPLTSSGEQVASGDRVSPMQAEPPTRPEASAVGSALPVPPEIPPAAPAPQLGAMAGLADDERQRMLAAGDVAAEAVAGGVRSLDTVMGKTVAAARVAGVTIGVNAPTAVGNSSAGATLPIPDIATSTASIQASVAGGRAGGGGGRGGRAGGAVGAMGAQAQLAQERRPVVSTPSAMEGCYVLSGDWRGALGDAAASLPDRFSVRADTTAGATRNLVRALDEAYVESRVVEGWSWRAQGGGIALVRTGGAGEGTALAIAPGMAGEMLGSVGSATVDIRRIACGRVGG